MAYTATLEPDDTVERLLVVQEQLAELLDAHEGLPFTRVEEAQILRVMYVASASNRWCGGFHMVWRSPPICLRHMNDEWSIEKEEETK